MTTMHMLKKRETQTCPNQVTPTNQRRIVTLESVSVPPKKCKWRGMCYQQRDHSCFDVTGPGAHITTLLRHPAACYMRLEKGVCQDLPGCR